MSVAAVGGIIASAFTELAANLVHKVTGKHPDETPALRELVERVVREAMTAGLQQLDERIQVEMAELGILVAANHLDDALRGAADWFKPKGEIPALGLDIEIVDEIPPPQSWDDIKTPPERP